MKSAVFSTKRKCDHNQRSRAAAPQRCAMPKHDAALIIDISGRITDCTPGASHLLGHDSDKLSGLELTEVIPKLPFSSNTPYYNLAYAVFHSANNRPMHRVAMTADGRKIPIDVSLSRTVIKGRHLIRVNLLPAIISSASESWPYVKM